MFIKPKILNPAISSIFTSVTIETEAQREQSKSVFGTYPYGSGIVCSNETSSRSIRNFTASQKLGLKTIIAHMCEIGTEIDKNSRSIYLCQEAIRHFKSSKEIYDEELRNSFCSLQDRLITIDESKTGPLLVTMSILIALLIKDSYCMNQTTRLLIIDFLNKAQILPQLSKVILLRAREGFQSVFLDNQRLSTSGLLGTFIAADPAMSECGYIPIFAFNSNELKTKNLPPDLEKNWPF